MALKTGRKTLTAACIASSGQDTVFAMDLVATINSAKDANIHCELMNDRNIAYGVKKPFDFYFIVNIPNKTLSQIIAPKLRLACPTLRCQGCSKEMSNMDYIAYRLRGVPSKCCNHVSERASNYMHVFHGKSLDKSNQKYIDLQLRTRFWASVDADWGKYRNLVQAITMIPHATITAPVQEWTPKKPVMISYLGKNSKELKKLREIAKINKVKLNTDSKQMLKTHALVHSLGVSIPDKQAIYAMAAGMPVFGNISKFYLSHYPDLPVSPITSATAIDALQASRIEAAANDNGVINGKEFVRRLFDSKRAGAQWAYLARFILNPNSKIDEVNNDDLPIYWGLQGGYARRSE